MNWADLDDLLINLHTFFPEINPNGHLRLSRELPTAESKGETGFPYARVPDNNDFEDSEVGGLSRHFPSLQCRTIIFVTTIR